MKTVTYNWDNGIFLIHVEAENKTNDNAPLLYSRLTDSLEHKDEERTVIKPGESRRFIISKKGIREKGVAIQFAESIDIKIYRLLDRAYLPTEDDLCRI